MEIYFNGISEDEAPDESEQVINFYEEMIAQILTGKPDPRFDNE